jgi:hypothetical protein
MIVPPPSLPEMIFGVMVLTCFAAFALTLAGVHLYVRSAPRAARRPAPAQRPAAAAIDEALAGEIL